MVPVSWAFLITPSKVYVTDFTVEITASDHFPLMLKLNFGSILGQLGLVPEPNSFILQPKIFWKVFSSLTNW